ncbi:3-isopropylmalate dehydratase large subunit [subsurface metagenome]
MGKTIIEKIIASHCDREVAPGDIVDVRIDARVARDFGGANVVKNIKEYNLGVNDPTKTFFTLDCNPGGSDQKYAANQQICRLFAREHGIEVFDINRGIGTHIAVDNGLVVPGATFVSTDSHANILGAIGAFGQGMGDKDIAYAFAFGKVWFRVPPTVKIILKGRPEKSATPKDITLAMVRKLGANGLLGYAAEVYGPVVETLSLDARITIASMATEMGGIIVFFAPDEDVLNYCADVSGKDFQVQITDRDAEYVKTVEIDIDGLIPLISRPGHPEDVAEVVDLAGKKIDSVFIGSCTNGRMEDLKSAAEILKGRKVAPGIVLKIVPATDRIWRECLESGYVETFKQAGALIGNAGCAGCAAGQIGQNGPGEITISTGNRNFTGKQGKGEVFLASPSVAAASAAAGVIALPDRIPSEPVLFPRPSPASIKKQKVEPMGEGEEKPTKIAGRVWIIQKDNIDTDMIYHNRHLAVTDIREMGQYTFGNLTGWEDFSRNAKPGDIVITGKNFGCGSSRQQAVECFKSLGIALIIAESFGAIYERNAVNAGFPVMSADIGSSGIETGQNIEVNLETGLIKNIDTNRDLAGIAFSKAQMEIYKKGGLLCAV